MSAVEGWEEQVPPSGTEEDAGRGSWWRYGLVAALLLALGYAAGASAVLLLGALRMV